MRKLDAQIPIKTLPEVVHALAHEITPDIQLRGINFRDRKAKPSHATAAMVLHFLRMDPDRRAEIFRAEFAELERLQDCDEYQRLIPRAETPPPAIPVTPAKPEVIMGKVVGARKKKRNNGTA